MKLMEQQKPYAKIRHGHVIIYNESALHESAELIFVVERKLHCLSLINVVGSAVALVSIVNVKVCRYFVKQKSSKQLLIISIDNDENR